MTSTAAALYREPAVGFNLVPLPSNAVPVSTSASFVPTPTVTVRPNSLQRLPELQRFLLQCDEPSYYNNYFQLLKTSPPSMLQDFLNSLKQRCEWLADQQEIEFKRMRTLDLLPPVIAQAMSPVKIPASNADANAFAQCVLEGGIPFAQPEPQGAPTLTPVAGTNEAAVEHHQLQRDSATPPNLANASEQTENAPPGKGNARQAKLKRKRT